MKLSNRLLKIQGACRNSYAQRPDAKSCEAKGRTAAEYKLSALRVAQIEARARHDNVMRSDAAKGREKQAVALL
jgi:hypothetical protein